MNRLTLISALLGVMVLLGCEPASQVVPTQTARPAKLWKVEGKPSFRTIQLPALIEAAKETVLTFQVPGLVKVIALQEGQEVKEGDILAQLDQRDFQNALASARAEYEQAQLEYQRAQNLIQQDAIAKSVVDQRLTRRNTAKAALDSAQKRLEDATLRAPYDTIIAKVHLERFENVAPQQPIVTLLSTSGSNAIVQVPASIVIKSETEKPVRVTLELDAAPGITIPTTLFEAAGSADPGTQTFEVRFAFEAPRGLVILPGMTGTLTGEFPVLTNDDQHQFEVPLSAVVAEAGETFVWVVHPETMKVTRRTVRVTPAANSSVTISGVNQGEILVSVGGSYLYEGAEVRPFDR